MFYVPRRDDRVRFAWLDHRHSVLGPEGSSDTAMPPLDTQHGQQPGPLGGFLEILHFQKSSSTSSLFLNDFQLYYGGPYMLILMSAIARAIGRRHQLKFGRRYSDM